METVHRLHSQEMQNRKESKNWILLVCIAFCFQKLTCLNSDNFPLWISQKQESIFIINVLNLFILIKVLNLTFDYVTMLKSLTFITDFDLQK